MIEEVPTFQGGGHDKTRDERRAILLAQFDGNGCDNCSIGLCAEVDLCAIGHGARSGQGFNPGKFRLEEARIEDIHRAIKSGQITCEKLVQAYINRIRAYDGMCVAPVNPNDAADPKNFFPDVANYTGTPLQPRRDAPTIYEPKFVLSADTKSYRSVSGIEQTLLEAPGLPISLSFWAGPGEESTLLKAASAYEAATKHRRPPPAFGPLPGEP